ncbi:MAG: heme-binding protein [Sedimenticola sp.]
MTELTLEQANRLIEASLSTARKMDLPPVAVAVLDAGGHLKSLQREDGVSFLRVQICQAKAWGALGLAMNSSNIAERYEQDSLQQGFINALNAMSGGRLIPLPGGVLIHDETGRILGAVGVAGAASEKDEACASAGIQAIGLK